MWKWTDASLQIGVLQHKKKFKYTRKVGNRYYYDDQKPTVSVAKEIPDNVAEFLKASSADILNVGIPKENQHTSITKNKNGGYDLTVTDKTNGKVMAKESVTNEKLAEFNKALSTINQDIKDDNVEYSAFDTRAAKQYNSRMAQLNAQKISNLTSNKAAAKKKGR